MKELPAEVLHTAILKSFTKSTSFPTKSHRYLAEASLLSLKDDIGLPIDIDAISGSSLDMLRFIKPIIQVLEEFYHPEARHNTHDAPFEKYFIVLDCLKLLRRLVELGSKEVNKIIQANAVPCLAFGLGTGSYATESFDEHNIESAHCLRMIIANGTSDHRKIIIDAGVVTKLCAMFLRPNEKIAREALLTLVQVISDKATDIAQEIIDQGVMPKLIRILDSSEATFIEGSLFLLATLSTDHIKRVIDERIIRNLFRIIKMPLDNQTDILPKCSVLLCKIIELDHSPISTQQVLDANLIPRLVELIKMSTDEIAQTNLAMFFMYIAKGATILW